VVTKDFETELDTIGGRACLLRSRYVHGPSTHKCNSTMCRNSIPSIVSLCSKHHIAVLPFRVDTCFVYA